MKGIFITFEGPDGAGKTTQIGRLAETLKQEGHEVLVTREPGGTPIGDQIRTILLSPENKQMADMTEVLLYAASRAQHIHDTIIPALACNMIVLCDRFVDASIAYQAYGLQIDLGAVRSINEFATAGITPNRTYLLDIPVETGRKRLLQRSAGTQGPNLDRIELKGSEYHQRVRDGFLQIRENDPERIKRIDADRPDGLITQEIADDCLELIQRFYVK